jgi:hypothetical protein
LPIPNIADKRPQKPSRAGLPKVLVPNAYLMALGWAVAANVW